MKTYKIHLIRHGMTKENQDGRYIGITDVPISDQGEEDLKNLSSCYEYPKVGVLYTSPLLRCKQTADILYPHVKQTVVKGLAECDFGDWEGKTAKELQHDENFTNWLSGIDTTPQNNGEPMIDFNNRVGNAFEAIVDDIVRVEKKDAAVITHGGVIMTLLALYGMPKAKPHEWVANNGCGYSVRIMPSLWMRSKIVEVYDKLPMQVKEKLDEKSAYIIDIAKRVSDEFESKN